MHTLLQRKNVAKMRRKSGARMCFAHSLFYIVPDFCNYFENMLSLVWACLKDAASVPICLPMRYPIYSFTLVGVSNLSAMMVP